VKTLHKYLTRQVLASLLLTLAVFTFVLLLGDALKEILPLLIDGRARFGTVIKIIVYLVPFMWVFALPMGFLTATLLVFGRFSADQELTAARASGVSLLSLVSPVLLLSLFFCGVCAWINMELGPLSRVAGKNLIVELRNELVNSFDLPEGRFVNYSSAKYNYVFYARKNDGGKLQDVIIFILDKNESNAFMTITAPRGDLEVDEAKKQMFLHLVEPREVGNNNVTSAPDYLSDNLYPTNSTAEQHSKPKISDMTFGQLRHELDDLERQLALPPAPAGSSDELRAQLDEVRKQRDDLTEPIRVAMNRQIAFSFACFGFTLVGIPLGIRMHRRETNIGVAIALGLTAVYFSFILVANSLSARPEFAPHLIVWLPNFIFQAVGAVLLWRANKGI
jgi:lipopolysaccharide export system permease protein